MDLNWFTSNVKRQTSQRSTATRLAQRCAGILLCISTRNNLANDTDAERVVDGMVLANCTIHS